MYTSHSQQIISKLIQKSDGSPDQVVISKHRGSMTTTTLLPESFPPNRHGPAKQSPLLPYFFNKGKYTASSLVQKIKQLIQCNSPLQPPELKFKVLQKATMFNFQMLEENNFNLHALLNR